MSTVKSKDDKAHEMKSLNEWIDHYGITKYRDKEYEDLMGDPEEFGARLANSMIDRLLRTRNLTNGSSGRS